MKRPSLSIFPFGLLPVLSLAIASCGDAGTATRDPPLSPEALEAVADDAGAPREELARKVDALFTRQGIGETRAVIVMHGGHVVAERYAPGYGEETRFVGWSMTKTITGVLIGMLVAEGKLRLDETPPIPIWQRTGETARRNYPAPIAPDALRTAPHGDWRSRLRCRYGADAVHAGT